MRAWTNTSMILQSAWSNGRSARRAAFRRPTCGSAFNMPVPGASSRPWQKHLRGHHV